jgi:hypothetical protein
MHHPRSVSLILAVLITAQPTIILATPPPRSPTLNPS